MFTPPLRCRDPSGDWSKADHVGHAADARTPDQPPNRSIRLDENQQSFVESQAVVLAWSSYFGYFIKATS